MKHQKSNPSSPDAIQKINQSLQQKQPLWREVLGKQYLHTRFTTEHDQYLYKVQDPFSEEIYHFISKEEFDEIDKANEENNLVRSSGRSLSETGYIDYETDNRGYFRYWYNKRVFKILETNQISSMDKLPEALAKRETQGIIRKEKRDKYEQTILNFLAKYENDDLETTYISDLEMIETVEKAFAKWHITDLTLRERFYKIQKRNYIKYIKRIYRYGIKYSRGWLKNDTPLSKTLDGGIEQIFDFLRNKQGTINDLDETPEHFKERIQSSYKKALNINRIKWHNYAYGYTEKDLADILWVNKEELTTRKKEAELEIKSDYIEKVRELNIEEDLISGNSSKGEYFIEQGWQLVCSHSQNDPAFWQELEQILQTYVLQGIRMVTQKHERPELLQKMKANLKDKDAKKNYHELFIERIIPLIDSRVTLLSRVRIFASRPPVSSEEDFDKWMEHAHRREGRDWWDGGEERPDWPERGERERNKWQYAKDYLDFYNKNFLLKRMQDTLSKTLTPSLPEHATPSGESNETVYDIWPQLIKDVKKTLYTLLQNIIKKQYPSTPNPSGYYPLSKTPKYINTAFLNAGYALTLKQLIPDKEERAYIRQGYIQTLTKELLQEIESRVMNKETFSPIEYCMREPLLYTYQKYGGKEEIWIDSQLLGEKYYSFMATSFENEGNAKLATLLTHLNGKTVPYKLYEEMYRCIDFISSKTKFFLQNTPTCIATPPKKKRKPTLKGLSYEEAYQQRKVEEEREWEENKKRDKERKQEREKLTRYNPEILSQLPPEIQKTYRSLRQKLEEIRPKILQKILQYWAQQNFAGRIKRIMEEVLQKKFWLITMSAEQRDFMITYLEQSLEQLMMEDIKENTKGKWFLQLFPVDREFLQNSIQQAIAALSQTKSLNGAIFTTPSLPEENFSA